MSSPFDFDKALKALQSDQALTGSDVIITLLIKQLTAAALAAEPASYLAHGSRTECGEEAGLKNACNQPFPRRELG